MKYLFLLLFIVGCESEPPTPMENFRECAQKCNVRYSSSCVHIFDYSRITDPVGLRRCLQACEKKYGIVTIMPINRDPIK